MIDNGACRWVWKLALPVEETRNLVSKQRRHRSSIHRDLAVSSGRSSKQTPRDTNEPRCRWSAIVRGAALRGLDGALVHKKICRRHYGTTYDKEFRPGIDHSLLDETYEHDFTGQKMVRGYMDWHFNKVIRFLPTDGADQLIAKELRNRQGHQERNLLQPFSQIW